MDGVFNMNTGIDDIRKLGKLENWNYSNRTGFFPDQCGQVVGTMGQLFPPGQTKDKKVEMFSPDLCRYLKLYLFVFDFQKKCYVVSILECSIFNLRNCIGSEFIQNVLCVNHSTIIFIVHTVLFIKKTRLFQCYSSTSALLVITKTLIWCHHHILCCLCSALPIQCSWYIHIFILHRQFSKQISNKIPKHLNYISLVKFYSILTLPLILQI